jgi:hypothetical protein
MLDDVQHFSHTRPPAFECTVYPFVSHASDTWKIIIHVFTNYLSTVHFPFSLQTILLLHQLLSRPIHVY